MLALGLCLKAVDSFLKGTTRAALFATKTKLKPTNRPRARLLLHATLK
jgi:hypothetical protein